MDNPKPESPVAPTRSEMAAWKVGQRVMVRVNLEAGSTHLYTDVLGYIRYLDDELLTLETRTGMREIKVSEVAIGKLIPPPPARRGRSGNL